MDSRSPVPPKRMPLWPVVLLIAMVIGSFIAWRAFFEPRGPEEAGTPVDAGIAVAAVDAGAPSTPALEDGEALLQTLARSWSGDPTFGAWLDALSLRHLVAATQLVADGSSPRAALPFVSIAGPFAVREERGPPPPPMKKGKKPPPPREERFFMSAESTGRYAVIAQVFGSIDAAAAGDAWARLEPYCEVVFAEISRPGAGFHDTAARAVKRVLGVKVPEGELELVPQGPLYQFKDPALEALSPAEKQLVRMGAPNAKVIQDQVRLFASHAHLD